MTLLVSTFAAIISTIVRYCNPRARSHECGFLALMFWAASIMRFVDAIFEYLEDPAGYFLPTSAQMVNDLFLGLSVVALGLIVWLIRLLVRDPENIIRKNELERA